MGFVLTFTGFLLVLFLFQEIDIEEELVEEKVSNKCNLCRTWIDVLCDRNFWKYLFFAIITIGMKMIFNMLSLIIPKILTFHFG